MRLRNIYLLAGISASMLVLSACGGGGGAIDSSSTLPPPATPTPTPTPSASSYPVNIFPNPKPETYASVGVSANYSTADVDQIHVRYSSGGYYELELPGKAWERLTFPSNVIPQYPDTFNYYVTTDGSLGIEVSRLQGYQYSEIGNGVMAFGSATPPSGVPITGSGTYAGIVRGGTDLKQADFLAGGMVGVPVTGTVQLQFDFGAGALAGSMTLRTAPYVTPVDLGTFAFKDSIFSVGSMTYSGRFDTPAAGQNFFLGRFTGPQAQETIGAWALPFIYSVDNQAHQAVGAWIAKTH